MHRLPHIEAVCWILGLALIGAYGSVRVWAESERAATVARDSSVPATRTTATPARPDQTLWSRQRIAAYAAVAGSAAPPPEGVLRLPAHGLAVPVYVGAMELNLTRGVALVDARGSLADGNIAIAGHRDGFFRVLKDVRIGHELVLETSAGVRRYRVSRLGIVSKSDISVLAPTSEDIVTLITCYPFYFVGPAPERYIVRAERVGS